LQIQDTLLLAVARQESSAFSAVLGDPIPIVDASILAGKSTKTRTNWFRSKDDPRISATSRLEHDSTGLNHARRPSYCLSMIFSENQFPLFRIML
jgi:hypothetical protein